MKLGPVYLLKWGTHVEGDDVVMDVGGMLHTSFQLVGDHHSAMVDIYGSLDPAFIKHGRDPSWVLIGRLSEKEQYIYHRGWIRWLRAEVVVRDETSHFGVALMGED
jgi:hypothetical protein